jgi:glycosyltransferase involved in cell wall biosynthesis
MARVTVLSRYMAVELRAAGVPAERIVCIPPFVDRLPGGAPGDARAAELHLLAGRLAAHKGVLVALDAARSLRCGLPLVVAGDGPLAAAVREEARRPGARVRYVGWADRAALGDLLRRACSVWLPAVWQEPFGIAGLEAMAAGVAVIASDVGGVAEWLTDAAAGLLVRAGSASDLARAADRLAGDPELARTLGARGRERVARDYEPTALMADLCRVYAEVNDAAFSCAHRFGDRAASQA